MLILCLILSAILSVHVWRASRGPDSWPTFRALVLGFGLFLAAFPCMTMLFGFGLNALVLVLLCAITTGLNQTRRMVWDLPPVSYLPAVLVAFVGSYGYLSYQAVRGNEGIVNLQARFPWVSLDDRLPRQPEPAGQPLGFATVQHLKELTTELEKAAERDQWSRDRRQMDMHLLHSATVLQFINSPNFGATRARIVVTAWSFSREKRNLGDRTQAESRPMPRMSPGDATAVGGEAVFGWYPRLRAAIVDFANPLGFGVTEWNQKNRKIGLFEPHAFSERPPIPDAFELKRLELVSLLLHDQPAVYVSDHLPAMEKARELPNRPLDEFEAFALAKLKTGEDLVLRQAGKDARVLGSIRSVQQCLRCHGGNEGDLLGAFSYWVQTSETRKSD